MTSLQGNPPSRLARLMWTLGSLSASHFTHLLLQVPLETSTSAPLRHLPSSTTWSPCHLWLQCPSFELSRTTFEALEPLNPSRLSRTRNVNEMKAAEPQQPKQGPRHAVFDPDAIPSQSGSLKRKTFCFVLADVIAAGFAEGRPRFKARKSSIGERKAGGVCSIYGLY